MMYILSLNLAGAAHTPGLARHRSESSSVEPTFVRRFCERDRAAHLQAYNSFGERVRIVVRRFFRSPFEQEDVIQEIWLLIYRKAPQFDPQRGDLGGWIWTLANNRCREILRSQGRSLEPSLSQQADQAAEPERNTPAPEIELKQTRLRVALEGFVAKLPPREQSVFRLSCMESKSHEEVAAATGLSARQCKYLRLKLLAAATQSEALRGAFEEILGK